MGESIECDMAGFESAGNSEAGTLGVGDLYADLYRRVDAPARSAAPHVLVLLNIREGSLLGTDAGRIARSMNYHTVTN